MDRIYLDHAATTYLDDEVLAEMLPWFSEKFGNANSQHSFGRDAAVAVDRARAQVAAALGAKTNEIYFTSGGTESDNWAIRETAYSHREKGMHLITSEIEHPAVLNTFKRLEKEGFEVTYLGTDEYGRVSPKELEKAITPKTTLISIMAANNEIGTLQNIREFGRIAREHKVFFHTDAVQAIGAIDIDVVRDNIDMLSLSAHKFYGPKGIGALYIKNGIRVGKLIIGGEQERGQRGGTTNVPLVVGLGKAIEIAVRDIKANNEYVLKLRDRLIKGIKKEIPHTRLNGHPAERLPNNANFSFEFIEGEGILMRLDLLGIATSSGSACSSGSLEPSHVLLSCGLDHATAHGSIRFTFGKRNTEAEVDTVIEKLKKIVENLRMMSPLFKVEEGGKTSV